LSGGPILYAVTRGPDDRLSQLGFEDQPGAASLARHGLGGAAHVDVQAIEAELADHVGDL
jgi:hypothetical protein